MVVVGIGGMMGYDNIGIRFDDCLFYELNQMKMGNVIELDIGERAVIVAADSDERGACGNIIGKLVILGSVSASIGTRGQDASMNGMTLACELVDGGACA